MERGAKARYCELPIPSDIDREVWALVTEYRSLAQDMRAEERDHLPIKAWHFLLEFSVRMANLVLRTGRQDALKVGLAALEFTHEVDWRDILVRLALYVDLSSRFGLDLEAVNEHDEPFASTLRRFLARESKDKSLEAMKWQLVEDPVHGMPYRGWGL